MHVGLRLKTSIYLFKVVSRILIKKKKHSMLYRVARVVTKSP